MPTESLNTIQTWEKESVDSLLKSFPIVDLMSVEAVDCETTQLPSAEDYQKQDRDYTQSYWELQSRKWSEPKYRCPACNEGGMRRDETIVLTSNPPSYRYECDKCHHITYHHIRGGIMQNHYCSNLLPDGVCKKTGKLCEDALPRNTQEPHIPNWLSSEYIPPACRGCSNHPSNGGTGICFCTLGGMEFTAGTSSGSDIQYTTTTNIAEG